MFFVLEEPTTCNPKHLENVDKSRDPKSWIQTGVSLGNCVTDYFYNNAGSGFKLSSQGNTNVSWDVAFIFHLHLPHQLVQNNLGEFKPMQAVAAPKEKENSNLANSLLFIDIIIYGCLMPFLCTEIL
jgi:hypothetical protein